MRAREILESFRTSHQGLVGVGYADLSTDMMLATSSEPLIPQERWDAMSGTAISLLTGDAAEDLGALLSHGDADPISFASIANRCNVQIFVRGKIDPSFALCCFAAGRIRIEQIVTAAQRALTEMAQDG